MFGKMENRKAMNGVAVFNKIQQVPPFDSQALSFTPSCAIFL